MGTLHIIHKQILRSNNSPTWIYFLAIVSAVTPVARVPARDAKGPGPARSGPGARPTSGSRKKQATAGEPGLASDKDKGQDKGQGKTNSNSNKGATATGAGGSYKDKTKTTDALPVTTIAKPEQVMRRWL